MTKSYEAEVASSPESEEPGAKFAQLVRQREEAIKAKRGPGYAPESQRLQSEAEAAMREFLQGWVGEGKAIMIDTLAFGGGTYKGGEFAAKTGALRSLVQAGLTAEEISKFGFDLERPASLRSLNHEEAQKLEDMLMKRGYQRLPGHDNAMLYYMRSDAPELKAVIDVIEEINKDPEAMPIPINPEVLEALRAGEGNSEAQEQNDSVPSLRKADPATEKMMEKLRKDLGI